MKTIEEILALPDADAMAYLKNRKTTLPDVTALLSDWNPSCLASLILKILHL